MAVKRKKKIKFLAIYNSFTDKEKSEFRKFLDSDLSGSTRNYNKILSSLLINEKGIVDIKGAESSVTRWNRFSELNLLAEKYLTIKSVAENKFISRYYLLKELDKRSLTKSVEHNYNLLQKNLSYEPNDNFEFNILNHAENIYLHHFKSELKFDQVIKKYLDLNNFRTGVFFAELLEYKIEKRNIRRNIELNSYEADEEFFNSLDFKKIRNVVLSSGKSSLKLINILDFLYSLYSGFKDINNTVYYLKAKKIFFNKLKFLSKENRAKYYGFLMDYNTDRINYGKEGAKEELFFIMNKKLKEGIINDVKNKNLPINRFRDYVYTGIMLKKFNWVKDFIEKYGPMLPVEIRNLYVSMGNAQIEFDKRNFLSCSKILLNIKSKDSYYFIDISVLKLKVLFELKNYNECHNELKNLKEYLRKDHVVDKKILEYAREFCKIYSKLLKCIHNLSKKNHSDLEFSISKKIFIGKKWLLSKSDEIRRSVV